MNTNTFAARAASGKITINEGGAVTNKGTSSSTIKVQTAEGTWELAFMSYDEATIEAISVLRGQRVSCNYHEK